MNERTIIQRYFAHGFRRSDVLVGVGDDTALLAPQGKLLMTLDTLVEERHFRTHDSPEDIGYKSLATNLSDVAAMGGVPAWAMLSLSLPERIDEAWVERFMQGFNQLAEPEQVSLIGGDLVKGPLVISIQVSGYAAQAPILRSGANAGDAIYVTGNIGASGLAWHRDELLKQAGESIREACRERLLRPVPRLAEGRILAQFASAAIDISDGVFLDLSRILEASSCGGILHLEQVPVHPALAKLDLGEDSLLPYMAGDDYELIFTMPAEAESRLRHAFDEAGLTTTLTQVGEVQEGDSLQCFHHQQRIELPEVLGFDHFAS